MKEKIWLKVCPFCGEEASLDYGSLLGDSYSEGSDVYSVSCDNCEAYLYDDDKNNVIELWNTRTEIKE